jgi:hypothetical protein
MVSRTRRRTWSPLVGATTVGTILPVTSVTPNTNSKATFGSLTSNLYAVVQVLLAWHHISDPPSLQYYPRVFKFPSLLFSTPGPTLTSFSSRSKASESVLPLYDSRCSGLDPLSFRAFTSTPRSSLLEQSHGECPADRRLIMVLMPDETRSDTYSRGSWSRLTGKDVCVSIRAASTATARCSGVK